MNKIQMPPQIGLKYGAYSGIASFLLFNVIYYAGYNPLGLSSWLGVWIMPLCMILGLREFSTHPFYQPFTYWRSFWSGFNICLASTLLFTSLVYIFAVTVGKDVVRMQQLDAIYGLEKGKDLLTERFYNDSLKSIELINIATISSADFFQKALGGLIVAFFAAAFFKQKKANNHIDQGFNEQ